MSQLAYNPYLLNIVPIFNIADPTNGFTIDTAATILSNLGTMIDTTNHQITVDVLQPFTVGGTIRMVGDVAITGNLTVNDVAIGPDVDGLNLIPGETVFISTGTSGLEIISTSTAEPSSIAINFIVDGESLMQINACGQVFYDGSKACGGYGLFQISSGLLKADAISTHSLTVYGSNTLVSQGSTILEGYTEIQELFTSSINGFEMGSNGFVSLNMASTFTDFLSTGSLQTEVIESGNSLGFTVGGCNTFTLGSTNGLYVGNSFWVSSGIFHADRAAINLGGLSTMSTIFDVWNGDAYFDGNVHVKNDVYCQNIYNVSDKRKKDNIREIGGALSTICRLNGVHYSMNGVESIGFLAQEVAEVVPEAVGKTADGYLAVDYIKIIPLLVEAVKELARGL